MSGWTLLRILVVSSPAEVTCIAWAPKRGALAFVLDLNTGAWESKLTFQWRLFFFCSLQFKDSGIELECIPDVCQTQNEYYIESTQEKSEMRTWAAEMHGKLNPGRKVWQDYSWPEEKFKSIQSIKLKKSLGKCCSNSWSEESRIWLCHREKHPYLVCQMDLGFLAQTLNTGLEEVTQVHRENR